MAYTRKQKAGDLAKGAALGTVINGAIIGTLGVASKAIPVVAKVASVALSAPVVIGVVGTMAAVGATRAYAKTGSTKDAATGAIAGSFGVFPNFTTQAVERFTNDGQARVILASDRQEDKTLSAVNRNLNRAEKGLKKLGMDKAATPVATPVEKTAVDKEAERVANLPFGQRMMAKTEHAIEGVIFGHAKPKDAVDPFDQRRSVVQQKLKTLNKELDTEVGRGGVGPKTSSIEKSIKDASGELTAIDREERNDNAAQAQFYRSAGAAGAGIIVGGVIGGAIKKGAVVAVEVVEGSLVKTAAIAGKAAASNPKGVIVGTLEGDRAKAAVASAKISTASPVVSRGEAYAVPVVTGSQGAIAYGVAEHLDKESSKRGEGPNAMATMLRTEATFSMALAGFAAKGAAAARSLRATISPTNAAKLSTAENRLARESRTGPAGVAQSKGREKVAISSGKANVATAQSQRKTEVARLMAKSSVERTVVNNAGKLEASKITSKLGVIEAGSKQGVAKIQGAAKIERAEIVAKRGNSRMIENGQAGKAQYKDVWIDKNGITKHRIDKRVRTRKDGPANDNSTKLRIAR
jgi:nucleoside diphosphate kinase